MSERVGLLLLDKPTGPTSHDIVSLVRRALGQRRVGHAGTLDPAASGLLPVVVGPATRLIRFLPASPKLYTGTLRLGLSSDTDDAAGTVTGRHAGPLPTTEQVLAASRELLGPGRQVTPTVSARKVGGQRLYRLARRGIEVEAPVASIEVFAFDLSPADETGRYAFRAEVSGGTYIRGLARDLGERLGCGGLLESLRRERIGPMEVDRALPIEPGNPPEAARLIEVLIPPETMPLLPPVAELADTGQARAFSAGNPVPSPGPAGPCRTVGPEGRLLGIGERRDGLLCPRVVLPSSD